MQAYEFTNEKHQQKILRLNEEINGLIANKYVARRGCLTTCYVSSKRTAEKFSHTMLFNVSTGSWKKHKRWLRLGYPNMEVVNECDYPNAIHQWCRFKSEVIKKPNYYKNNFSLTEEKRAHLETALAVNVLVHTF